MKGEKKKQTEVNDLVVWNKNNEDEYMYTYLFGYYGNLNI